MPQVAGFVHEEAMNRLVALTLIACFVLPPVVAQNTSAEREKALPESARDTEPLSARTIEESLEGEFGAAEIAATNTWIEQLGIVDWLGPLAPVAMSPFFAVTCLSGLALWGPESMTDNALLGASGPLRSETVFFVFLGLTLLTSLPRLTKVSKPFAQAVDRIETYSVLVILLVIKFGSQFDSAGDDVTQVAVVQFGIISFTAQSLLAVAMVINVLVINSVKFFFEFLVWLTPIPFLDAIFEVCNKTICACLMAIYAFSPTLATLLNLLVLVAAALVLRWISRHVRFYRTMILDPVIAKLWTSFGRPKAPEIVVFPRQQVGPFKPKSRLRLRRAAEQDGWHLEEASWWTPTSKHLLVATDSPTISRGWVMHTITAETAQGTCELTFSRRYDGSLERLADELGLQLQRSEDADVDKTHDRVSYEFS